MKRVVLLLVLVLAVLATPVAWSRGYYRGRYYGPRTYYRPRVTYHVRPGSYVRISHYPGYTYAQPVYVRPHYYYCGWTRPYYYYPCYRPYGWQGYPYGHVSVWW